MDNKTKKKILGGLKINNQYYIINTQYPLAYLVRILSKNKIEIYKNKNLNLENKDYNDINKYKESGNIKKLLNYYNLIDIFKCKKIFYGVNDINKINKTKKNNKDSYFSNGNSFLLHINNNKYMYIGEHIYTFNTLKKDERIINFYGYLGNSNLVYPYAISNDNIYFLMPNNINSKKIYSDYMGYIPLEPYFNNIKFKNINAYDKLLGINDFSNSILDKLKKLPHFKKIKT